MKQEDMRRIGQILLELGACQERDISSALEVQSAYGGKLGTILVNMGMLTEEQLLTALGEQFGLEVVGDVYDLRMLALPVQQGMLLENKVIPFRQSNDSLDVLTNNPLNTAIFSLLELISGKRVKSYLTTEENLERLVSFSMDGEVKSEQQSTISVHDEIDRLKEMASEAPVIKLVNGILIKAAERKASDIHFEAMRNSMQVRLRVDGVLHYSDTVPENLKPAVIARLKLLSGMNVAENRLPQDGRITIRVAREEIDIRSSSVPTQFGESFVLRLLSKGGVDYSLEGIGFYPDQVETIRSILKQPNGIFLTTGPTGSGKTTTLYSILKELNSESVKIVTVEDPVEYEFKGINQINVRSDIDYTFATSLRSILRQDPDIIMVGEIRDLETAEISIHAALTGHLVLSTLHTNSALASMTRLLDMGIEPFLLKASMVGAMAQRLVRRLCPDCRHPATIPAALSRRFDIDTLISNYPFVTMDYHESTGCSLCNHTGYKGRTVLAEVIPLTKENKTLLETNSDISSPAQLGCRSTLEDGVLKVVQGITSFEEVLKVTI